MSTPEGKVKAHIKKVFDKYHDYLYYYMPVPSGYGKATLDYIGIICGVGFVVEAKRPGKAPTPRQEVTITDVRRGGGTVFVIDGDNGQLELLDKWLAAVIATHHARLERQIKTAS